MRSARAVAAALRPEEASRAPGGGCSLLSRKRQPGVARVRFVSSVEPSITVGPPGSRMQSSGPAPGRTARPSPAHRSQPASSCPLWSGRGARRKGSPSPGAAPWSAPWNEIVVDGRGNAYINNQGFDFPGGEFRPGTIALLTPCGAARLVADGIAFPNGMAATPDNSTLIVAVRRRAGVARNRSDGRRGANGPGADRRSASSGGRLALSQISRQLGSAGARSTALSRFLAALSLVALSDSS